MTAQGFGAELSGVGKLTYFPAWQPGEGKGCGRSGEQNRVAPSFASRQVDITEQKEVNYSPPR